MLLLSYFFLGLLTLSLLILGLAYYFRHRSLARREERKRFTHDFKEFINDYLTDEMVDDTPPFTKPREKLYFLDAFNDIYETASREGRRKLESLAETIGLRNAARRFLEAPESARKLTAIRTLGYLRDENSFATIFKTTWSPNTLVALNGLKSSLLIDFNRSFTRFLEFLCNRENVKPSYLLGLASEIDPDVLTYRLFGLLENAGRGLKLKLIPFLKHAEKNKTRFFVREELKQNEDSEILCAYLRILRTVGCSEDETFVQQFLDHSHPGVRTQSVRCLKALGSSHSLPQLIQILHDTSSWVRFRAAEALVEIVPDKQDLKVIFNDLRNPEAKSILSQEMHAMTYR